MIKNKLKIMALNIGNPSVKRVQDQIKWIESRDEDIFILTETKNSHGCNLLENYFLDYGNNLFHVGMDGMYYVSFPKSITNDLGVMCISKFPIEKTYHYFPHNSCYYSRFLELQVNCNSRKIHLTGVYVPSRDRSKEKVERKQFFLEKAINRIKEIKSFPCIICGDFNILDRNHIPKYSSFMGWEYDFYDNLISLGYIDAFRLCNPNKQEYSWVGRTNDGYRYDYCFISKDIAQTIENCYFIHETRKIGLTDHSAIVVEIGADNLLNQN